MNPETPGANIVAAAEPAIPLNGANQVAAIEAANPLWRSSFRRGSAMRLLRNVAVVAVLSLLWQLVSSLLFTPVLGTTAFALPRHAAFLLGHEHGLFARSGATGRWRAWLRTDAKPFWKWLAPTLEVWSFASAGNYQTLYIGTNHGDVWRSTDGGAHWSSANLGTDSNGLETIVTRIVANPRTPSIVYASGGSTLYESRDSGASWRQMNLSLSRLDFIQQVVVDPHQPTSIWLGTNDSGLHHSVDGGRHWFSVRGGGLPNMSLVSSFAVSPNVHDGVYVSLEGSGNLPLQPGGLYQSRDSGRHWTHLWRGLPANVAVDHLTISPVRPYRMYAEGPERQYVSTDGGKDWAQDGGPAVLSLTADPIHPLTVYVVNNQGVWESEDGGKTWQSWGNVDLDLQNEGSPGDVIPTGPSASSGRGM